jgi:hypothetical protein
LGIIISTRKDEKTPLNQTQAFLSLSRLEKFENIRIIFLSNCYKEGTAMGLEDYPNVKIEAMDTTLSSAMQIINSKYISILESDSPIPVDLYEEGIEKMNRNPKIQIVFLSSIMRGEKQVKEIDDNFLVKQSISDEIFGEDKRSLCISNLLLRNGKIRRYLAQRYVYSRGWEIFQFYNLLLNSELSLGLRKKITTKQIFNNQKIDFKLERKWHQAFVDYLSKHDLLKKFKKFVKPINLRNLYAGYFSNINEEQRNILEEGLRDVLSIYRYILEKSFSQEILSKIPDSNGSSYYKNSGLDIAIITDTFAYKYFEDAANLHYVNKENYKDVLGRKKIDMLLFVTCWYGMKNNDWVGIAGDPIVKQKTLEIFNHAKKRKIPVVFWSKEDPTNYEIFLEYAKASDYIFTTAEECINEYKKDTGNKDVYLLKYGVNPFIHNPIGFRLKNKNGDQNVILFAGTWYPQTPAYKERIKDQEMLFDGVLASKSKELVVIDRNFFKYEQYEYPMQYWNYIYPSVEYGNIQKIRKLFDLAINLNIVKDSKTMCAARVYELQAMGVAIISNYSKAVKKNFTNISIPNNKREVTQVINKSHGIELFKRQVEGIRNMFTQNTVFDRIGEMITAMGKSAPISGILPVTVVCEEINPQIEKMFQKQKYENKVLLEVKDIENLNSKFVTFFSEKYMYGQNYLQDLVNGFKFTDVFYVTKGVIDLKKDPNMSDFHHYVSSVSDKYRTMYNLKKLSFKRILKEEKLEELGYVIDPFEITTKK